LAATIEQATGVQPTLIEGGGGVFDVTVDGRLIYSKHATGQFPEEEEILAELH
jgi:selT/selW/selH-like putative selenoprotein